MKLVPKHQFGYSPAETIVFCTFRRAADEVSFHLSFPEISRNDCYVSQFYFFGKSAWEFRFHVDLCTVDLSGMCIETPSPSTFHVSVIDFQLQQSITPSANNLLTVKAFIPSFADVLNSLYQGLVNKGRQNLPSRAPKSASPFQESTFCDRQKLHTCRNSLGSCVPHDL